MITRGTKTMRDTIYRADAIEAIQNAYCKPCKERGDDYYGVRCRTCEYDNAIIQIDALPSADTEWIPCSEKLPEKEELVLVTVWNDVVIAWRNRYGGWESVEDMYEKGDVIAWQPLPKPYKGGDDE